MVSPVKRQYRSTRRDEQAQATRATIRDAALRLFTEQGYVATTIQAIADEAGVAVQTVYARFGNKAAIVAELLDVSIVGDEEPVPVAERPMWLRIFEPGCTPGERLHRYSEVARHIYAGAGPVYEVIRKGADADPALAALWSRNREQRRWALGLIVDKVMEETELVAGVDREEALDRLWLLNGPEVFMMLTGERGWSLDHYQSWLGETFCQQVLPPERRGQRRRPVRSSA